jgi:hypothetical protein
VRCIQGFDRDDPARDAWLEDMVAEIEKMELLVSEVRHGLNQLRGALRLREKLRQLPEGTAGADGRRDRNGPSTRRPAGSARTGRDLWGRQRLAQIRLAS